MAAIGHVVPMIPMDGVELNDVLPLQLIRLRLVGGDIYRFHRESVGSVFPNSVVKVQVFARSSALNVATPAPVYWLNRLTDVAFVVDNIRNFVKINLRHCSPDRDIG